MKDFMNDDLFGGLILSEDELLFIKGGIAAASWAGEGCGMNCGSGCGNSCIGACPTLHPQL